MPIYVISTIKQKNNAEFPIVEDIDLKGGYRIVADITTRNAIFASMRVHGMRVHVVSEDIDYKLEVGLTNADWEAVADGAAFELLGFPTVGDWDDSFLRLDENTRKTDAIWRADQMLGKLAPPRPDDLSTKTLVMSVYVALEAVSGDSHDCTDDTTPTAVATDFGDGADGTLIGYIDTIDSGSTTLTINDDTGTYGALNITDDSDPYVGQPGKEGIYAQLTAEILPVAPISVGQHEYYMEHTLTGITPVLSFYVDDPINSGVSNVVISLPGGNSKFISGIPTLSATDNILFSFRVDNAVRTHYNAVRLGSVTGANIDDFDANTPASPPAVGASVDYLLQPTNVNGYAENLPIIITPYGSNDVPGTVYGQTLQSRVDLISDESDRVTSGSGQYPVVGYGDPFNSTSSLKVIYTDELQMLNGKYQRPTGDYSSNLPTSGQNYDIGMGTGDRRVTFQPVVLNNHSAFTIEILGAEDFTGQETPGVEIQVKVEGQTGWLNANASYPGTGNPSADGDPAMVFAQSDGDTKRITFGSTARTGNLLVRIGLPDGSIKKFRGIDITNLI